MENVYCYKILLQDYVDNFGNICNKNEIHCIDKIPLGRLFDITKYFIKNGIDGFYRYIYIPVNGNFAFSDNNELLYIKDVSDKSYREFLFNPFVNGIDYDISFIVGFKYSEIFKNSAQYQNLNNYLPNKKQNDRRNKNIVFKPTFKVGKGTRIRGRAVQSGRSSVKIG